MKRMSTKALSVLTAIILLINLFGLVSCKSEPVVIKDSDTCIVIKGSADSENKSLLAYMESLKSDGKLEFTIVDGMITSINGIDNPADYSSCWMLYTSDADNANSAWGTVMYAGAEYGSAIVGAADLIIKPDCLYIWAYIAF